MRDPKYIKRLHLSNGIVVEAQKMEATEVRKIGLDGKAYVACPTYAAEYPCQVIFWNADGTARDRWLLSLSSINNYMNLARRFYESAGILTGIEY